MHAGSASRCAPQVISVESNGLLLFALVARPGWAILEPVGLTTLEFDSAESPLFRLSLLAGHHSGHFRLDPEARNWSAAFFVGQASRERSLQLGGYSVGMKLYVGNLGYDVTNASLEELFATYGAVRSAQVVQDRDTGRSKGFGFVEMGDDNAARAAITALNEQDHGGRPLTVNEARPREERGGGGGFGGRRGNFNRR